MVKVPTDLGQCFHGSNGEGNGPARFPSHGVYQGLSWRGFRTNTHLRATNPTLLQVTGLPNAAAQALHYSLPPLPALESRDTRCPLRSSG